MGGMRMMRAIAALGALLLLLGCNPTDILKAVRMANGMTAEGFPIYRVTVAMGGAPYSSIAKDQGNEKDYYIAWRMSNSGIAKVAHSADSGATWPAGDVKQIDAPGSKTGRIQIVSPTSGGIVACYVSAADLSKLQWSSSSDYGGSWTAAQNVGISMNSDGSSDFSLGCANSGTCLVFDVDTTGLVSYGSPWPISAWTAFPTSNVIAPASGPSPYGHGNCMAVPSDNSSLMVGFIDTTGSGSYHAAKLSPVQMSSTWDAHGTVQQNSTASSRAAMTISGGTTYYACSFEPDHSLWLHYGTDIQGSGNSSVQVYTGVGKINPVFVAVPGRVYISFYEAGSECIKLIWSDDGGATWPAAKQATIAQKVGSPEYGFLFSHPYLSFCYYGSTDVGGAPDRLVYASLDTGDLP